MRYLLFPILAIFLPFMLRAQSLHSFSVQGMQGQQVGLSTYSGKKILIVLLPHAAQDTLLLPPRELAGLRQKYSTLVVIGIPSVDAGYTQNDSSVLKSLYPLAGVNTFYTKGMKASKLSGVEQDPLFKWLTSRALNGHFDNDAKTMGYKFFVDEAGKLYGVLSATVSLSSPIVDKILDRVAPQ